MITIHQIDTPYSKEAAHHKLAFTGVKQVKKALIILCS